MSLNIPLEHPMQNPHVAIVHLPLTVSALEFGVGVVWGSVRWLHRQSMHWRSVHSQALCVHARQVWILQ